MTLFSACDCGERNCFPCAVGYVITSLGLNLGCECFKERMGKCSNRCGYMHLEWKLAFEMAQAPYTAWAESRSRSYGLQAAKVTVIQSDQDDIDITDNVLLHNGLVDEGSVFGKFLQNTELAAKELGAEVGDDPISFDAARLFVARLMREGLPIPEPLREWSADVMSGTVSRPQKPGKTLGATMNRDRLIVRLVTDLGSDLGLNPTSSDREKGQSACHAVARAFAIIGLNPTSYESIVKIWRDRQRLRAVEIPGRW